MYIYIYKNQRYHIVFNNGVSILYGFCMAKEIRHAAKQKEDIHIFMIV